MRTEMSQISVSHDHTRATTYEVLSAAVAYPDERTFHHFPTVDTHRGELVAEYDTLFRNRAIWLFSTEYTAKGQFQKTQQLADISGFYRAFGVQIEKERPDALSAELEFMYFLIFKSIYAAERNIEDGGEKKALCDDAQAKFFETHLYPAACAMCAQVGTASEVFFYTEIFEELMSFMDQENHFFSGLKQVSQ